jgi:S-adenosylmethionine:tRNA ribosyltransferase-isomerase
MASRSVNSTDRPPPALPTSAFDYELPHDLIAHHPARSRDESRLLVLRRSVDAAAAGALEHRTFRDIVDLIEPGDVLVLNETRVIPARLLGRRPGGGEAEIVLLREAGDAAYTAGEWGAEWLALVRPGSKLKPGRVIPIAADLDVEVLEVLPDGSRRVRLATPLPIREAVQRHGRMPLPPYIERDAEAADAERYQTVYAKAEGSVAAPTAGLHFTPALLDTLRARGVEVATLVLHVGAGTFRPVEVEDPDAHEMHAEWYEVTAQQAARINAARARGGRLWAVGTTVTRTLESVVERNGAGAAGHAGAARADDAAGADGAGPARIVAGSGWTRLFIRPGFEFRAVDRLITNFHLPRSTLLMLVSAFAGHDRTLAAYREAVRQRYRFYSYGDAMAII